MIDLIDRFEHMGLQISFSIDVIAMKLSFISSMLLLKLIWLKKH
jgi:hypothetical protein